MMNKAPLTAATIKATADGKGITIERTESAQEAGQRLSAFIVDKLDLDTAKNNELVRLITEYAQEVERGAFAGGALWIANAYESGDLPENANGISLNIKQ